MRTDKRIPFFLILRHLRRANQWTLALIIFLLAIAFINLIFINSLFNGVIESNNEQIIAYRTGNISMSPARGQEYVAEPLRTATRIEEVTGVKAAAAETEVPGSMEFNGAKGDYSVTAIDPASEKKVTDVSMKMVEGSYLQPGDREGIIIGAEIAGEKGNGARHLSFTGARW